MSKWFIKGLHADVNRIASENNISRELAILLANRGIIEKNDIDQFLDPRLDRMHKPELMKDIIISGDILQDCIEHGKRIRIIGDYDVDGISSVYILYKALYRAGADVDYVIPDRIQDGYGINQFLVLEAKAQGIDTIVTVDNGISAFSQTKLAKEMGMRVIITDHHDIPEAIPPADAIVNPKQEDCLYPEKMLCGAGIALKLSIHLLERFGLNALDDDSLEIAALATICDVVDLVGENRIIAARGLEKLNNCQNIGLKALLSASGLTGKKLGVYHVGFIIGPSLNASGRLDSAILGLELLLSSRSDEAMAIAIKLRELNEERQSLTRDGVERVENLIESQLGNQSVIVAFDPHIHESVAGIVAGRVKEKYNRPTIVLTRGKEGIKGSARSIEGYHIFDELNKVSHLLERFGGHPMAAGLSLKDANLEQLRELLNRNSRLTEDDLTPKIYIEMQMDPGKFDWNLLSEIEKLEPFGKGNPKPLFGFKGLKIHKAAILGKNSNVLKLIIGKDHTEKLEGVVFSDPEMWVSGALDSFGKQEVENALAGQRNSICMDIVYYPSVNDYMGRKSIQFVIDSYRFKK